MYNTILGRGRGGPPRIGSTVIGGQPQLSIIGRGRGGPLRIDSMAATVQKALPGSGAGQSRIEVTDAYPQQSKLDIAGGPATIVPKADQQFSLIGRGRLSNVLLMTKADDAKQTIIGRGKGGPIRIDSMAANVGPPLSVIGSGEQGGTNSVELNDYFQPSIFGAEEQTKLSMMTITDDAPKTIIGKGRGGPVRIGSMAKIADSQQGINTSGGLARSNSVELKDRSQQSIFGREGPAKLFTMSNRADDIPQTLIGRGRGGLPRIGSRVTGDQSQQSIIVRGRGGPQKIDSRAANADLELSITGSGGQSRIDAKVKDAHFQKPILGGKGPRKINSEEMNQHSKISEKSVVKKISRKKSTLVRGGPERRDAQSTKVEPPLLILSKTGPLTLIMIPNDRNTVLPDYRLGEDNSSSASEKVSHWLDQIEPQQGTSESCKDRNLPDDFIGIHQDYEEVEQSKRSSYSTETSNRTLEVQDATSQNPDNYILWSTLGCNENFPNRPPLLQMEEHLSGEPRDWKAFTCSICNLVCPPPSYFCKGGHILCFSCTSVLKVSTCPIMVLPRNTTERVPCKQLLEPNVLKEDIEEYLAHNGTKYCCPFKIVGCGEKDLLPQEVVEHAQKQCPYRYEVKCFIGQCDEVSSKVRVGFYKEHCVALHGSRIIELKNHRINEPLAIPFDLHANPNEKIAVPILFVEQLDAEIIFPLVVMRTKKFVYFWIYEIAASEGSLEPYHADFLLNLRFKRNLNDEIYGKPLEIQDVNHDISVSIKEVVKSGKVLKVDIRDFYDRYLTIYQDNSKSEINRYFYLLKVDILRVSDIALLPKVKYNPFNRRNHLQ